MKSSKNSKTIVSPLNNYLFVGKLFFVIIFAFNSTSSALENNFQIDRLIIRPSIPIDAISNSDDSTALYLNPAGLSLHPLQAGYFYGNNPDKHIEDHIVFLNIFGIGFSTHWRFAPNSESLRRYTVGTGLGSNRLISMGLSFSWFDSKVQDISKYNSLDLGLLLRPHRFISLGVVGRNLLDTKISFNELRYRWDIGTSIRPLVFTGWQKYQDKLTLSFETTWVAKAHIRTLVPRYILEICPMDILNTYVGIDHKENLFVGLRFYQNLIQLSLQGNIPGIKEEVSKTIIPTSERANKGNAFNVGLLIGQERFKTEFEAISYFLEISLDLLPVQEKKEEAFPFFFPEGISFFDVLNSLKKAADDPQVNGIIITGRKFKGGWGQAEELRNTLKRFNEISKKPIYAFLEEGGNKEYYIATAAKKIIMPPAGSLLLNGLKAELLYVKDTLDKVGIKADFITLGKYKTASDMYTKNSPSRFEREQILEILHDLSQEIKDTVISARKGKLKAERLNEIINYGFFTPEQAKTIGLIDNVSYINELEERIKKNESLLFLGKTKLDSYIREIHYLDSWGPKPIIAVVVVEGTILSQTAKGIFSKKSSGSDELSKTLSKLRGNSDVKGLVIRIDSPGGSALASDILWKEISLFKKQKIPVIVSFGNTAASGGYYIAMGADHIVSNNNTITGSIGVFSGKFSLKKLYELLGVHKVIFKTAKNAAILTERDEFTENERKIMKEHLQSFYDLFLQRVKTNREKIHKKDIKKNADGRVYTGKSALKRGMVDVNGSILLAIELLMNKQMLNKNYVQIEVLPKRSQNLLGLSLNSQLALPYLVRKAIQLMSQSEKLQSDQVYFMMPYQIDIE